MIANQKYYFFPFSPWQEAQGAIHESRALKSRVHLAEAAQKEARNMEVDYEEAMRLLEDEIAELNHKLKVAQRSKVSLR